MNSQNAPERNPFLLSQHLQCQPRPHRSSEFADNQSGCGQQPTTLSLTTTTIHNALSPSPPCHHHQRPPPLPPTITCPTQRPQHAPTSHEEDDNAMSPLKNVTTPCMNEPPPGATSPTAIWQPDNEVSADSPHLRSLTVATVGYVATK